MVVDKHGFSEYFVEPLVKLDWTVPFDIKEHHIVKYIIAQLPSKFHSGDVQWIIDQVFEIGNQEMKSIGCFSSNLDVRIILANVQYVVSVVNDLFLRPYSKHDDTFFFPQKETQAENIQKLKNHLQMAKNTIEFAIFALTHDELENEILAAH